MTDRLAKKRAAILRKYGGTGWAWHWPASGELIARSISTGKVKNLGHVTPGPHRVPCARPALAEGSQQ